MNDSNGSGIAGHSGITRRRVLRGTAGLGALALSGLSGATARGAAQRKGRITQSIVQWCFADHWKIEKTCEIAVQLGCKSVELVDPKDWGLLKKHNLVCAIASRHGFERGMNNPKYQAMCLSKMRDAIDACADAGFPSVITFTGFRENVPDDY